jgi:hypothetical protein
MGIREVCESLAKISKRHDQVWGGYNGDGQVLQNARNRWVTAAS